MQGISICNFSLRPSTWDYELVRWASTSFSGRSGDLDMALPHKLGDYDRSPGRTWLFEVRLVNGVHPLEGLGIGQVDLHAHDIPRRHSPCFEDSANVVQSLFHFGFENAGNLAGGVLAAHTRYEECVADGGSRGSRKH